MPPAIACSIACEGADVPLADPTVALVTGDATAAPPDWAGGTLVLTAEGRPLRIELPDGTVVTLTSREAM